MQYNYTYVYANPVVWQSHMQQVSSYGTAQLNLTHTHVSLVPRSINLLGNSQKLAILSRVVCEHLDKVIIVTSIMHIKCTRVHSQAGITRETSTRVTVP